MGRRTATKPSSEERGRRATSESACEGIAGKSPIRTIRADGATISALLAALEKAPLPHKAAGRSDIRYPVRLADSVLSMRVGGNPSHIQYAIIPFDISEKGIGILHGGYIHTGTECQVRLSNRHGGLGVHKGVVKHCALLSGVIHRIGVAFSQKINVVEYTVAAVPMRILVADDNPLIHHLVSSYLNKQNATAEFAESGQEAIESALKRSYDVIFMDLEMPEIDGFVAVRRLREDGYPGTIVALTAITEPDVIQRCMESGFDEYVSKPCNKGQFLEVITKFRREPLVSSMINDAEMQPLIEEFVESLPKMVRTITRQLKKPDMAALERECRRLKGVAASFGFDPISEFAHRVEESIKSNAEFAAINQAVVALTHLCASAR